MGKEKKAVRSFLCNPLLFILIFAAIIVGNRYLRIRLEGGEAAFGAWFGQIDLSSLGEQIAEAKQFSYTKTQDGIWISEYTGTDTSLFIPAEIMFTEVVGLGRSILRNKDVTEVIFSEDIKSLKISEGAFYGADSVTTIKFPEEMDYLYLDRYSLNHNGTKKIVLPRGRVVIENSAFFHAQSLEEVVIPECGDIGERAFSGCSSLRSLTLGMGTMDSSGSDGEAGGGATIGEYAFAETQLCELTIPGNVTALGSFLFDDARLIEKVVWEPSVNGESQMMWISSFCKIYHPFDLYLSEHVVIEDDLTWLFVDDMKKNVTFHVPEGSFAAQYAEKHGFSYVIENWYE